MKVCLAQKDPLAMNDDRLAVFLLFTITVDCFNSSALALLILIITDTAK